MTTFRTSAPVERSFMRDNEAWRPVVGMEAFYAVSDQGRVRSIRPGSTAILKPYGAPYPTVNLRGGRGVRRAVRIHRLVAEAFLPRQAARPHVNHIDGNKRNNCVSNLEWVTVSENNLHSIRTGLRPARKGDNSANHKLSDEDVRDVIRLTNAGLRARPIAERFGITPGYVYDIRGRRKRFEALEGAGL